MSLAMPILTRAAAIGTLIGVGLECASDFESKGKLLAISVIASVALNAIAYFFNVGTAVGVTIALVVTLFVHSESNFRDLTPAKLFGCLLLGGTLGYLIEPALAGINWVVLA